jgi:hypothetical protein
VYLNKSTDLWEGGGGVQPAVNGRCDDFEANSDPRVKILTFPGPNGGKEGGGEAIRAKFGQFGRILRLLGTRKASGREVTQIGTLGDDLGRYARLRCVVSRSALTISNALQEVFELARPTEKFKRVSSKTRLAELGGEQHKPRNKYGIGTVLV